MVKRCPPSDSGNSSEYELKPDISDEENEKDFEDSKSPQKKVQTKKSNKSPPKTPAHTKRVWTPEEEKIFLEIMSKLVKSWMWDAVKDDGRLGYRGAPGIAAHVTSIMNKVKKSSGA